MHWFTIGVALLVSVGIIAIGLFYLFNPLGATQGFGLPRPDERANIGWWLRLKGIRDIVSGLVVLALVTWGGARILGLVLLIQAMIPVGDMSIVLAAKGSAKRAFGIHGLTAALMIAAAIPLTIGLA